MPQISHCRTIVLLLLVLSTFLVGANISRAGEPALEPGFSITNDCVIYSIQANGKNEQFVDRRSGRDYALSNSPCARIKRGRMEFPATTATFTNGLLKLQFGDANAGA